MRNKLFWGLYCDRIPLGDISLLSFPEGALHQLPGDRGAVSVRRDEVLLVVH